MFRYSSRPLESNKLRNQIRFYWLDESPLLKSRLLIQGQNIATCFLEENKNEKIWIAAVFYGVAKLDKTEQDGSRIQFELTSHQNGQ